MIARKVVGTTGGDAVAFKNPDGTLVVVMDNSEAAKSTITVAMGGKKLQFSMSGSGWDAVKNWQEPVRDASLRPRLSTRQ